MFGKAKDKKITEEKAQLQSLIDNLAKFYSNKSTDEYKIKGDITKSPCYDIIETDLANMSSIKRYPENDVKTLKNLFNTLHRPRFSKMTMEYLKEPNETNIIFASCFVVGYRILIGEISRVIASTEISEKGFIYKPDKISRKEKYMTLARQFNNDLESRIDELVRKNNNKLVPIHESAITDIANIAVSAIEGIFGIFNNIFSSAAALNPIALMSAILSRSYDKKVEKYEKISKEYEVAKKAYEDWKKIPVTDRKERTGHRYVKMIEKYNIKMEKIKKEIEHFDMRSQEEAQEHTKKITAASPKTESKPDTSTNDTESSNDDNEFDF